MAIPAVTKQVWCERGDHLVREQPFQPLGANCPDPLVITISSCDRCLTATAKGAPPKTAKRKRA